MVLEEFLTQMADQVVVLEVVAVVIMIQLAAQEGEVAIREVLELSIIMEMLEVAVRS